ncbi:MAG: nitroreductase [Betaproteobacteria bacterium SG8_39]|nr:MAG: nitroreductase [Betaproteobacteria bacterium SG8_39]
MSPHTAALAALLAERYSCRGFLPQPVPRETIEKILEIAQRTPSWCNSQPWRLVITSGAATERFREALYDHAQRHEATPDYAFPREYRGVYLERRRECGFQLYAAVGVQRGDREAGNRQTMENFRLFGAPHAAIITTEEALGIYGAIDCGAYVNNFMLAAKSLGVASIAQAALARHPQFTREFFGLPEARRIVCGISFGFEDAKHPANRFRTSRAALDAVADWRDA